ncbi:hypothetical protein MKX01_011832 [Papaver californicum]|nr:hypothetical protein MKX01_011832 [Papaver californicum]
MKKLYKKGKIHPSPHHFWGQLAFLPATILTLTVALSPEDREKNHDDGGLIEHSTSFNFDCFRWYTSFWFRWDCSPNRQLIHEIIYAYENDNQLLSADKKEKKMRQNKKDRKKKGSFDTNTVASSNNINDNEVVILEMKQFEQIINSVGDISDNNNDDNVVTKVKPDLEKGSMKKLISFLGGRILGVWN